MDVFTQILSFIVGLILPMIFANFLPNEKFYAWGRKVGRKLSSGGRTVVQIQAWEQFENNITGSFLAFANGLRDGADDDDPEIQRR